MATSDTVLCLLSALALTSCAKSADVSPDLANNLKTIIEENFSKVRHHAVDMPAHIAARNYIKDTFEAYGFSVELQPFTTADETINGTNVIGVRRGTNSGTANDSVLLVGAHYDTTKDTPGVDNNGSGLAAMLEMLRLLLKSATGCQNANTLIAVAFDSYEEDDSCPEGTCGSQAFVKNGGLQRYIGNGTFQGAFIMDSIMNFDEAENSQSVFLEDDSTQFDTFNRQFESQNWVGNFLFCSVRLADKHLSTAFKTSWNNLTDDQYKFTDIGLNIAEPPTAEQKSIEFIFDGDHAPFWNNDPAYSALYFTDTKSYRSVMKECYHKQCDNATLLTPDRLNFLAKTTQAMADTFQRLADCKAVTVSMGTTMYAIHATFGLIFALLTFTIAV